MSEQEKISLTRKELLEVRYPSWVCLGRYNQEGCDPKCSVSTFLFCRKVTLFLGRVK